MAKVKTVSLVDAINKLALDPEVKKMFEQEKKMMKESPARHNRKYNLELMNICMELNGRCKMIAFNTQAITSEEVSNTDRDLFWTRRAEEIAQVAQLQARYNALVAQLDQAIIDEDRAKVL